MPDWLNFLLGSGIILTIGGLFWKIFGIGRRVGSMEQDLEQAKKSVSKIEEWGDVDQRLKNLEKKVDEVCVDVKAVNTINIAIGRLEERMDGLSNNVRLILVEVMKDKK